MITVSTPKPAIVPLLQWQKAWINDDSRFKFIAASVQSGKSFGTSLEYCLRAQEIPRRLIIFLSAGERQSVELMEKVKQHTAAWNIQFEDDYFRTHDGGLTEIIEHRAKFPNGSRIIALPANPDTARGYSGDVFLDEFALHRDSKAIWAAMMSRVTRGYAVRVASTFKGTNNKFYELAKQLGLHEGIVPEQLPVRKGAWSGHLVTIEMAAAQGMPVNVMEMREAIGDEDIWLQDYMCVPMEDGEAYIPLAMVLACESGEASLEWDRQVRPGLSAGFDVARKRDAAVIVLTEPAADLAVVRGVITMRRMRFADMKKVAIEVAEVVKASGGRFAVDSTGIGTQIAEELSEQFTCVESVEFGSRVETGAKDEEGNKIKIPVKERMASEVKRRFEERTLRIPESRDLRAACTAVKRYVGPTGAIRLDAERTDKGHADEFWALALAVSAMSGPAHRYIAAEEGGLVGDATMAGLMGRQF